MTDAQAARFVAALDRIDASLFALRHEFDAAVRQADDKLAELRVKRARQEQGDKLSFCAADPELQPA